MRSARLSAQSTSVIVSTGYHLQLVFFNGRAFSFIDIFIFVVRNLGKL